jgi:hypothetical protein
MDNVMQFISKSNISRMIDDIENCHNAIEQNLLRKLLFIEEERFNRYSERLQITQRNIAKSDSRIVDQERRIEVLKANGSQTTEAEQLLNNMLSVRELLINARRRWAD